MPSTKVRLDLTVQRRFKEIARDLARKRRRSISGLFEDLIEEEMIRQKKIWHTHIKHVLPVELVPLLIN
jgi:predicted transcriptional regulator